MFKNREIRIRAVKIDDTAPETPVAETPPLILPKKDIKEMMILGAICVTGIVVSVTLSSAIEKIIVHHATK